MRLSTTGIPSSRRFCVSKRELREAFRDVERLNAYMGSLQSSFSFDPRCHHRPQLGGPVVASVSVSRDLTAILQVYSVPIDDYPNEAVEQFREAVLPHMKAWLLSQLAKPQTSVLGYEELVVEWTGNEHREHALRFL